jgi:hypothetical protein
MKITKGFTTREKSLLVILILVIIGAVYFLFVHQPVSDGIDIANKRAVTLEEDLAIINAKAQKISGMKDEMAEIEKSGKTPSAMPSYNSSKQEIDFLHGILSSQTLDYMVNFTEITREGNQIRRKFSLNFTGKDYNEAESILEALENSEVRCLIGDLRIQPVESDADLFSGEVDVSCIATFYETMYGGKADSDLPEDKAAPPANTEE